MASLFSALHDLREDTRSFLLWADGICINQGDNEEKAVQVQLMGRIFEGATNTIVYLGPASAKSNECECLRLVREGYYPSDTTFLFSIFGKEWFTRVCVFQKLAFAANPWVQCGNIRVRWMALNRVLLSINANSLQESQKRRYEIISQMHQAWESYQVSQKATSEQSGRQSFQISMLELVSARRGLSVTDPRDMVFAHVGFASDRGKEGVEVDYSKTCKQVYCIN
jgi:hypothetical protein